MSVLAPADFSEFFRAVWDYPPFAWQTRLVARVRAEGWPSALDLPTGSGKTAALDVALLALALDAFEDPAARRQPRRIVLVVDRRTVVDQRDSIGLAPTRFGLSASRRCCGRISRRRQTDTRGCSLPLGLLEWWGREPVDAPTFST